MTSNNDQSEILTIEESPLKVYLDGCAAGKIRYQVDPDGKPVFFPRLFAPGSGGNIEWREATGAGTVYAATTIHPRGGDPYNVVLVDMDEGFRMMSTVRGTESGADVPIGMRVTASMEDIDGEQRPVFVEATEGA
ncbi:MAG: OB-fold domain-containing protein [Chloroflexota bacterium]